MAYVEVYVHQVIGLPTSDIGHLPNYSAVGWTLCGGNAIENGIKRLDRRNRALREQDGNSDRVASWWTEPDGRRPCKACVHQADREHLHRLQQIEAMGGRP